MRTVLVAAPDETVREVARRMRENDLGEAVVVDEDGQPLGVLTEREIAIRCVGAGQDPDKQRVDEAMTAPAQSVRESTAIEAALTKMAGLHTRRLVVQDDEGRLVGLLALEDVLELLAEEAESIGRLLRARRPRTGI